MFRALLTDSTQAGRFEWVGQVRTLALGGA